MTMVSDIITGITHSSLGLVDPSYWTLTVELIFYIAIAVFVHFFSSDKIRYFLCAWLGISALAFLFHIDENVYVKLLLVRHASYFIFGGALALIANHHAKNLYEKYFDWGILFFAALYSVGIHTRAIPLYVVPNPNDRMIITVLLILFFLVVGFLVYVSRYVKSPRTIRVLAILGGISYPLYLLHQKIGNTLINYMMTKVGLSWNVLAVGFEVVIIFVAYGVYVQDKKLRTWIKERF
jgi:peptidoglycan/LPS O-acetylase OafA/YrhL